MMRVVYAIIVVTLERQLLSSALGGSNEPFLNKPARFPMISPSNAVRAGSDKKLLLILHKVLSQIETSEQAFNGLCIASRYAIAKQKSRSELFPQLGESEDSHLKIIEFVDAFVTTSIEGQVAAIGSISPYEEKIIPAFRDYSTTTKCSEFIGS